jgi:methionyl-tRNA synthetase
MNEFKRYTVTAALPYANGPLHIGHIAGAYLPADIYVRYLRAQGKDVAFICGSDEHGAAITLRAKKEGISPKEIIDKYNALIKDTFEKFGISFDIYHRTSSDLHHETSQAVFRKLYENGKFTEKISEQYYDEQFSQFLADRYITGTCPKCSYENAYGDQCEKCGTSLSPTDLIEPKSILSGKKPVLKTTKHWYLPMQDYENWLKEWIVAEKKDVWKSNVYGQCKSWIDQGLHERAMTRDLDWGVKVPVENAEGKVLYVWLDAPIGYISATKAWAEREGRNWEDYWKSEDTCLLHFIGKDNIVFHCIIFPIILKAHGEFILPQNVPANEFLNLEGDKISTSRNWAVWLHEFIEDFPENIDSLRYVLTSIAPETKDSEFTWADFQTRHNSELADILGNFINRAVVLTNKYFGGVVPSLGETTEFDNKILDEMSAYKGKISGLIEQFKFREAQFELMNLARLGNKYLADAQPWKLAKDEGAMPLVGTILNIALQISANIAVLIEPFLPTTAVKLRDLLGNGQTAPEFAEIHKQDHELFTWKNAGKRDILKSWHKLNEKPYVIFPKIEDSAVQKQIEKLQASKKANVKPNPIRENVSFEDFAKLDLRAGKIVAAEKVAKTKKLLKLTVFDGFENRTIVSGIAEHYEPEALVGKQVCFVANFPAKDLKGIPSQGMILTATNPDGSLSVISPERPVSDGAEIK